MVSCFGFVVFALVTGFGSCSVAFAASTREGYYAHKAVEDEYGVIAPWDKGQNGPLDTRLRIAVEVMKRYPWVSTDKAVMAAPDFIYNSHWNIEPNGVITIPPTNDWMCGDLGQRAWSIIKGLTAYYAYSGDPIAFVYVPLTADYILDYAQTPEDHDWPRFPISTPTRGKAYGKCDPNARIQLDLCAIVGTEILRAYKLTGHEKYFEAAKHWGDVFAQKCNLDPSMPPWNRYVDPSVVGWSDELTGGATLILEFLDELIRLGYTGKERRLIKARNAGQRYVRDVLLPQWLDNDVWARNYWDWDNPVMCGIVSMCGDYIVKNPQVFANWKTDLRNILTLIFNRNGADPHSMGDTYSGAWAFPESCTCCGTSLSYNQYTAAPTLLRYGVMADDERIFEIGRRMMIMATYDSHENGVVCDGLLGHPVATREWSNLAHPWPLCQVMEATAWTPSLFAPKRENHIVRSTSVVDSVIYGKNRIEYSTFDAPHKTIDVLRLAFMPTSIRANDVPLPRLYDLKRNGFSVMPLAEGDLLITIRHDSAKHIVITGNNDPQHQIDDGKLRFAGKWKSVSTETAFGGTSQVCASKGANVSCLFKGNQVRVIGSVDSKGGLADVYLDGVKQLTLIDCWNPSARHKQLLYYKNGLGDREHEIRIVVRGKGNLISEGANVYIDAIQYSEAKANVAFGSGGGPTGTQRMIFGYPDRADYVDSMGNTWRPATEWVVRAGYGKDTVQKAWWMQRRSMYIGNTRDPELYRYGAHGQEFWVNVTVGPGKYYAKMMYAETPLHGFLERNRDGGRITHTVTIRINGKEVASNLNLTKAAGGTFNAFDMVVPDITPKNGIIEVHVIGADEQGGILQALEIGPMRDSDG